MKKILVYAPLAVLADSNGKFIPALNRCGVSHSSFISTDGFKFDQVSMHLWRKIFEVEKLLLCFTLLFFSLGSFAQTNSCAETKNEIRKVTAENENYIWEGTDKGLLRTNKKTKKHILFNTSNSQLPSDNITSICIRKSGEVWVGTPKGIMRYDNYAYLLINTENSELPDDHITSMTEDSTGDLWIGTLKGGLVKVHNNKFIVYNHKNSPLTNDGVYSLNMDAKGNIKIDLSKNNYICVADLVYRKK